MDLGAPGQIESLTSLSRRQIAQASEHLVWRSYASDELILPHHVLTELQGMVYRGRVQVAAVERGDRHALGYLQAGASLDRSAWTHDSLRIELRAVEPTTLCFLPDGTHALSPARASVPHGADRVMAGALMISLTVLIGVVAWYWQTPWRTILSELVYGLASLRLDAGDHTDAALALQTSLDLSPRSAHAHNDMGYLLYGDGKIDAARAAFQAASAADPTFAVAQNNLGVSYLTGGQVEPARETLRRAVTLNPESATAWVNLGVAEQRVGDLAGAIRAYRAALRLDPHQTTARLNLGIISFEQGAFAQARQFIEEALGPESDLPEARVLLGAIALNEKDYDKAWSHFQAAANVRPNDPSLHFYLAVWYEEHNQLDEVQAELERVMALQPPPKLVELVESHLLALWQP